MGDTPEELHAFAARLGLRREWAQGDHFDLVASRRPGALALGAVEVPSRDLVRLRRTWREKGLHL